MSLIGTSVEALGPKRSPLLARAFQPRFLDRFAGAFGSGFVMTFGVVLPLVTLGVEWWTRMCAHTFFDPIPSLAHVGLVAAVPAANMAAWWLLFHGRASQAPALHWLNGFALGIAAYYALLFLPIAPFAAIAIVFGGLGFLPLSPLLAFSAACVLWRGSLSSLSLAYGRPYRRRGFACALLLLIGIGLPQAVTQYALSAAVSEGKVGRTLAVQALRWLGDEDSLLRSCYRRQGRAADLLGLVGGIAFGHPTLEQAREVFFRVTGVPFNARPAPRFSDAPTINPLAEFTFDGDQGGEAVAGRLKNVQLASSYLNGTLDADGGLGYLEWTIEFRNADPVDREARALLELPPGGVVSRATLWVKGEPREAVIAARGQARAAYEKVVRARRDPLLVTTQGPGRVLVQCFPVQPGGTMRIRLGITAPLSMEGRSRAALRLPFIAERNFGVSSGHSVWLESKRPFASVAELGLEAKRSADDAFGLKGDASDAWLASGGVVRLTRDAGVSGAWAEDGAGAGGVRATLEAEPVKVPGRLVVVIDGSRANRKHLGELAETLQSLPRGMEVAVLAAGDEVVTLMPAGRVNAESIARLASRVRHSGIGGGADNLPALAWALDLAAAKPDGAVLWVHGPQPVLLSEREPVLQRLRREGARPLLLSYETEAGANRLLEGADGLRVARLPRLEGAGADLRRLFDSWSGERTSLRWRLERASRSFGGSGEKRTSDHLVRLWARERVAALAAGTPREREEALALAVRHRLITPVSGGVVLETDEQYRDAGLDPNGAKVPGVPTVPEPETWLLIGLVLAAAAWERRRRLAVAAA